MGRWNKGFLMHKKEIIVRHHNKEDISGILALLAKCFPAVWGKLLEAGRRETWYNSDSTVAVCDGRIVGNCGLLRFPLMLNGKQVIAANLGSVAVDPDCRGMGIAKLMIKEIIDTAVRENIFFSALFTGTPAVYENSGWKIVEMTPSLLIEIPDMKKSLPENVTDKIDDGLLKEISSIYDNSFSFNGKIKRSLEYWKGHILSVTFSKRSWFLKYTGKKLSAYAVISGENTLSEIFSLNDDPVNLEALLKDALAFSGGKLICALPPEHQLRKIITDKYSAFVKPTNTQPIMINIIDPANPEAASFKKILDSGAFYWTPLDNF